MMQDKDGPQIVALVPIFDTDPAVDRFCVIRDGGAPARLDHLWGWVKR
jgi:hypothetical protein